VDEYLPDLGRVFRELPGFFLGDEVRKYGALAEIAEQGGAEYEGRHL